MNPWVGDAKNINTQLWGWAVTKAKESTYQALSGVFRLAPAPWQGGRASYPPISSVNIAH